MNTSTKIVGFLAASIISSHATVVWTGASNANAFDETNWDFSGSAVTAVDPYVSILDDVTITNGTIDIPDEPGQVRLQLGDGFTMTLDNSILGPVNNDGVGGAIGGTGIQIDVTNGSQFNPFFIVNAVALDIDGTSSATFGGGGNPINLSTVNLTDGAVLAFLNETPGAFATEHLSKVTVDGAPAVDGVNIMIESFNGNLGSRITVIPIPEPSSILLSALAGFGLLIRRR